MGARGVTFREAMAGWFALGATDPEEGARLGRASGTRLRIRVRVVVPDLRAFLGDRQHAGHLDGRVDFAPLGRELPASRGDFRLFSPAPHGEPGKRMVYGLSFAHEGGLLHLAGHKAVRGGGPWRLWPETTTLYTTLHREGIGVGPAIGAGVLRLGPLDFVGILPTLRAPGARGAGEALATLARFGTFFGGELWDSYARPAARARTAARA